MSLTRCPYCKHSNPADSRTCSACGGELHLPPHLAPCPHCGAVGPVKATVCYWCLSQLPGHRARLPSRVIVGTALVAAIAVLGYYGYRQRSLVDAPQPPAAGSAASGREAPAGAGIIGQDAAAGDTKSTGTDNSIGLTSPAISTPPAAPAPAAADQPRAGRQPVESRQEKATPAARTQAVNAGKAVERRPYRPEACTEGVAALGLCTPETTQRRE
jgi:hypothetical protein